MGMPHKLSILCGGLGLHRGRVLVSNLWGMEGSVCAEALSHFIQLHLHLHTSIKEIKFISLSLYCDDDIHAGTALCILKIKGADKFLNYSQIDFSISLTDSIQY